jgi:hypothetical protein
MKITRKGRFIVKAETSRLDGSTQRITEQLELVNCGKKKCKRCRRGASHGPYWYAYLSNGRGTIVSVYVGRDRSKRDAQLARYHNWQRVLEVGRAVKLPKRVVKPRSTRKASRGSSARARPARA